AGNRRRRAREHFRGRDRRRGAAPGRGEAVSGVPRLRRGAASGGGAERRISGRTWRSLRQPGAGLVRRVPGGHAERLGPGREPGRGAAHLRPRRMAISEAIPRRRAAPRFRFAADPAPIGALAALVCILPMVALFVLAASGGADTLRHLAETRLAAYARNSAALALMVGAGVALLGVPTAWLVSRYRFPG